MVLYRERILINKWIAMFGDHVIAIIIVQHSNSGSGSCLMLRCLSGLSIRTRTACSQDVFPTWPRYFCDSEIYIFQNCQERCKTHGSPIGSRCFDNFNEAKYVKLCTKTSETKKLENLVFVSSLNFTKMQIRLFILGTKFRFY